MLFESRIKYHLWIGFLLGIWIYIFLVFVGPFDAYPLRLGWRAQIMIGYGLVLAVSYYALIPIQNRIYYIKPKWNISRELLISAIFLLFNFPMTYFYYKSDFILGEFEFYDFLFQIYLATMTIFIPLILFVRWAVSWFASKNKLLEEKINIQGENKLDSLHILPDDLVYVKSADNYVEVYFQKNGELQKKLLRSTLKKIQKEVPALTMVHRSYLINTAHFVEWKDKKSISLTLAEVPVSDKYRDLVLAS